MLAVVLAPCTVLPDPVGHQTAGAVPLVREVQQSGPLSGAPCGQTVQDTERTEEGGATSAAVPRGEVPAAGGGTARIVGGTAEGMGVVEQGGAAAVHSSGNLAGTLPAVGEQKLCC